VLAVLLGGASALYEFEYPHLDAPPPVGCNGTTATVELQCPEAIFAKPSTWLQSVEMDEPQQVPCRAVPKTCQKKNDNYICTQGVETLVTSSAYRFEKNEWAEIRPGKPAVCGLGNREFSFYIRPLQDIESRVIFIFLSSGICYDAASCGESAARTLDEYTLSPPSMAVHLRNLVTGSSPKLGDKGITNADREFAQKWNIVIIPDCTGDMHAGAASRTYDSGKETCTTFHHRGSVNAGMALDWALDKRNFGKAKEVLLVGTGLKMTSKVWGAHGAAYWAEYVQTRLPSARVRTVIESSMGVYGPEWKNIMHGDPWGTRFAQSPDGKRLMPDPERWNIMDDDMTEFYKQAVDRMPSLAFADVTSTDDAMQKAAFVLTGGKEHDCCVDGCSCNQGATYGVQGGKLDWTKARKVTLLNRHLRLGDNYRSWVSGPRVGEKFTYLMLDEGLGISHGISFWELCPRYNMDSTCPEDASGNAQQLGRWLLRFAAAPIKLDARGRLAESHLPGGSYHERVFGDATCMGCLDGILGSEQEGLELCNATLAPGETFFKAAPKYKTDWLALWSLNGIEGFDGPDVAQDGALYRFAHQYDVQDGDTLAAIATRFGTTEHALIELNYNLVGPPRILVWLRRA